MKDWSSRLTGMAQEKFSRNILLIKHFQKSRISGLLIKASELFRE